MSAAEEVVILTRLAGQRQVVAGLLSEAEAMGVLQKRTELTGLTMERTAKRSYLMNQALFTMRRFMYMGTLALTAFAGVTVKWGYDYLSQMQQGRIALGQFMGSQRAANRELRTLFNFTAYTPFQFKDVVSSASMLMRFNINAGTTNRILRNITDALAGTTKATPAGLNRISTALGHMMSIGHVTGQVLLQLARDGIPGVYEATKKYFGLTSQQMTHIGPLGIPASMELQAINQYIEGSHLHGLAKKIALGSLHGLLTTSKDFLSQIMGGFMSKPFSAVQGWLPGLNAALQRGGTAFQNGGGIGGMMSAMFGKNPSGTAKDVEMIIGLFRNLWTVIAHELVPAIRVWLNILAPLFVMLTIVGGAVELMAHHTTLLKWILVILIADFVRARLVLIYFGIAARLSGAAVFLFAKYEFYASAMSKLLFMWQMRSIYAMVLQRRAAILLIASFRNIILVMIILRNTIMIGMMIAIRLFQISLLGLSIIMEQTAIAATIMWEALMGPVGWTLALITVLGILYWRWKAFRDVVNETWSILTRYPSVGGFLSPILGPLGSLLSSFVGIYNAIKGIYGLVTHPIGSLKGIGGRGQSWWKRAIHIGAGFLPFPGLASGGIAEQAGWAMVGENGPEFRYLPRGAVVQPLGAGLPFPMGSVGGGDGQPTIVQLIVDGKKLAEIVASHKNDVRARR